MVGEYVLPRGHARSRIRDLLYAPLRLHSLELPDILARHRAGDPEATQRLLDGFEHLVWRHYAWLEHNRNLWLAARCDEVLGMAYLMLAEGVDTLRRNDVPASGVRRHLWGYVCKAASRDYQESNVGSIKYILRGPRDKTDATPDEGTLRRMMREARRRREPMNSPNIASRAMQQYQRRQQLMKAIDELPESVRPDLVEALRQIADGTAKLADFVELYGVPYSALKLWVRDAS